MKKVTWFDVHGADILTASIALMGLLIVAISAGCLK